MITVYKKSFAVKLKIFETLNDLFFNRHTVALLDDQAKSVIMKIDQSEMLNKYTIRSRFNETTVNIDKLSTGCKTALNILYNPQKVFDICECGDNALNLIYNLPSGNICCDYPMISFDMESAMVCDESGTRVIESYEKLKEWWTNEN